MGSSGVADPVADTQITIDWAIALIDALDTAYDDIDTLQADLDALEATVAGLITEGDYSSYSLKHTIQCDATSRLIHAVQSWIPDESKFLYAGSDGSLIIVDISAGTITNTGVRITPSNDYYYASHSIFGKYFVGTDYSNNFWMKTYKDGVLLQTIDVDDTPYDYMFYPCVSPSGKYIIVIYYDYSESSADHYKMRIYEGNV